MGRRTQEEVNIEAKERLQQVRTHTAALRQCWSPALKTFARDKCMHALSPHTQAIACKLKHKLQDAPPVTASCAVLGSRYGVGVGLYFQILSWLRWLIIWLALCMVRETGAGLFLVCICSCRTQ